MSDEIDALQAVAVAATAGARSNKGSPSAGEVINLADDVTNNNSRKRPFQSLTSPVARLSNSQPFSHFGSSKKQPRSGKKSYQPKIWNGAPDPEASAKMDVAVADMIHSNLMPFTFGRDIKFLKCIDLARYVPADYITPDRRAVGGKLLKTLYTINWQEGVAMLVSDSMLYGVTLFGDGATIRTIPMINALAAGVNNPFCLLDVFDCSEHCSNAGKKDASYIAKLFLPLIKQLENTMDKNVSSCWICMPIVSFFYSPTYALSFKSTFRTKSTKELLILCSLTEHLMSRMLEECYKQGIRASQWGTVQSMSSLSSFQMSSPRCQNLRFLQTLPRSFGTFLDLQGMSPLPYSTSCPRSTTRASALVSSNHLTVGWLVIKLLYCVCCASRMHSRLRLHLPSSKS